MKKHNYFLGWLTEANGIGVPLLAWGIMILLVATLDFAIIKTGLGDYDGIDKSSDFALWYNLVFNSIAVSSNLGGPFDPSGWILLTVAIQDPLGLLFYGVTIAKLVNRSQERMLEDISHKVHLMLNEEDWDSLLDALRERSWKLKNKRYEGKVNCRILLKELVTYANLLLQQRPYNYKDNVINHYEYEIILRYLQEALDSLDVNQFDKAGDTALLNTLFSSLFLYHNGLRLNDSPLVDDPTIEGLFNQIANGNLARLAIQNGQPTQPVST